MRKKGLSIGAAGLAAAGLILVGGTLVAGAQNGSDSKKDTAGASSVGQQSAKKPDSGDVKKPDSGDVKKPDSGDVKKPDAAEQKRLRTDLDDLLKQRADLDRRIAEKRARLGETGGAHRRFEFRNGDGPPQVFEFNGDGNNLPPEARKQLEEAQKRLRETFGNMKFDNLPDFDFKSDGATGPDGIPDMKAFREQMQKWSQEFRDRMKRNSDGAPGQAPGEKSQDAKPKKSTANKPKTYDI